MQRTLYRELEYLNDLNDLVPTSAYLVFGNANRFSNKPIKSILSQLSSFSETMLESTLEMDLPSLPSDMEDTLMLADRSAVNRISLRTPPHCRNVNAYRKTFQNWSGRLNIDLPENDDNWLLLKPDHVSLYRDEARATENEPFTENLLESQGYRRYEFSHFAQAGHESVYLRQIYCMNPCLAIGPGAESTIPGSEGRIIRRIEESDRNKWIHRRVKNQWCMKVHDLILEHFMMGLRLTEGISVKRFQSIFGLEPIVLMPQSLSQNIFIPDKQSLKLSSTAMLNSILEDIAMEIDKHALNTVKWPYSEV